jgi:hypothetical protein
MMNIFIFPNPVATPTEPFPIPMAVVSPPSANALAVDATFSPVMPPIDPPGEGAGAGVFPKLSPPKLSFPKLFPKLSPPKLSFPKLFPKLSPPKLFPKSSPKLLPKLLPNSFNTFSAAISILIILLFIWILFLFRIRHAHWVLIPRGRGRGAWFGSFFHTTRFQNKIVI